MGKKINFFLLGIIIVAAILRLYQLAVLPGSLSPDEAALGYTASSLLKTGADTHGTIFPLAYSVFGSAWTLIGYPLSDIIPQFFLGLNEFSIRLPSALAGVAGVILIYFIADKLFKNKNIALFAALVYAISPWNIYYSRMAYEANLALPFFLGGLLCFINYVYKERGKEMLLVYSAILFSLTQFIYYSYVIFIPIFIAALFVLYKSSILQNKKIIITVIILSVSIVLSLYTTFQSSIGEASTLSIVNDKNIIYQRAEIFRVDHASEPFFMTRLLHTKYFAIPYQFAQNYINSFTPSFLFDKGGNKIVNDIGYFGKLYIIDALFLLLGAAMLFYRKEKSLPLLSVWFLIAPIASAITRDAPSSTRLFLLMPLFSLIIAYGMNQFIVLVHKRMFGKFVLVLVAGVVLLNFVYFVDAYFIHFNYQRVRFLSYGYKQAVEVSKMHPDYNVVMRGPENFPFIYFLVFTQYDPAKFREEVQYYPPTHEDFRFVKSFGKYRFVDSIDYNKLEPGTIYIDDRDPQNSPHSIQLPSGEPILGYTIVGEDKK